MNIGITFHSAESPFVQKLLADLAPHLLWALLVLVVVILIGPKRIGTAILNARKIGFGGLEIELKGDIADAAAAKNMAVPPQLQDQLARRAEQLGPALTCSRLLWIDDNPTNNALEIRLLNRLGISIDLARGDDEAKHRLALGVYDLVLSDMGRGGVADAGRSFMPHVLHAMLAPPMIFYVGHDQDTPQGAFGLTTRPDELINLVFDVVQRRRG
jgi:CheY-like chemotaxis protein